MAKPFAAISSTSIFPLRRYNDPDFVITVCDEILLQITVLRQFCFSGSPLKHKMNDTNLTLFMHTVLENGTCIYNRLGYYTRKWYI